MVNFRYHLVSLIAVFLALGVGVVLGAGPLQNAIDRNTNKGTGVGSAELSEELAEADQQIDQGEDFVWAMAQELLPQTLSGFDTAVIVLPGAAGVATDLVVRALEDANANVVGQVELTSRWDSNDSVTYRQMLATAASPHLQTRPDQGDSDSILAQGLVEVLTQSSAQTDLVEQMLTDEQTALVVPGTLPEKAATAIVLVGPSSVATERGSQEAAGTTSASTDSDGSEPVTSAWSALAAAASHAPAGAVAVGSAAQPTDFIAALREAAAPIATVDEGGTARASLNVALALASGAQGSYGQEQGASSPIAPLP